MIPVGQRPSLPNPTSTLQTALSDSLADRHLSKDELTQLKGMLAADKSLSAPEKANLLKVLEQARDDSKGFLFFKGSISDRELGKLQQMADKLGDSPIANELRETFEEMITTAERERSAYKGGQTRSAAFEPDGGVSFPSTDNKPPVQGNGNGGGQVEAIKPTLVNFNPTGKAGRPQFARLHVSQNGNNLPSGGGDCGPAVGSSVLKHFGILDQSISNRDAIMAFRRQVGVTKPRNGRWAISEAEITKGIEGLSKGKVRLSDQTRTATGAQMRSEVKAQLAKGALPIIEVASPYGSPGRHYMVALAVKPNGNIEVADPGGKRHWEITPDQLDSLVKKGNQRGGSMVLSYSQS